MKRGLPVLALLASLLLHTGVVAALILYPATEVETDIPPVIQLVELAPPPAPEPLVAPEPVKPPPPPTKPVAKPAPKPKPLPKSEPAPKPVVKAEPPQPAPQPEPPAPEPVKPAAAQPAPAKPVYEAVNVQAAYLSNPRPDYPSIARRRGWEGVVVLQIDLDEDGEPQRVEIADSSGHRVLDKAAQAAVRRWRFNPATRDGEAIAARGVRVPIQFRLDDA